MRATVVVCLRVSVWVPDIMAPSCPLTPCTCIQLAYHISFSATYVTNIYKALCDNSFTWVFTDRRIHLSDVIYSLTHKKFP